MNLHDRIANPPGAVAPYIPVFRTSDGGSMAPEAEGPTEPRPGHNALTLREDERLLPNPGLNVPADPGALTAEAA